MEEHSVCLRSSKMTNNSSIPRIINSYDHILKGINSYTPEVTRLEFDCLNKKSEIKIKIKIPDHLRNRDIEFLHPEIFKIKETYDGNLDPVYLRPTIKDGKLNINSKNIPKSEKLMLILNSDISNSDIKDLVQINTPTDPEKKTDTDEYWVHSAIRNMNTFEKAYRELNISNVQASVKVGITKAFASFAPPEIIDYLEANASMNAAVDESDRGNLFRQWTRLRTTKKGLRHMQTYQIFQLIQQVFSQKTFRLFIEINRPFKIYQVTHEVGIPQSVNVSILTELTKKLPAVHGALVFKKKDFGLNVEKEFKELISPQKP